jgi:hypothetical protein
MQVSTGLVETRWAADESEEERREKEEREKRNASENSAISPTPHNEFHPTEAHSNDTETVTMPRGEQEEEEEEEEQGEKERKREEYEGFQAVSSARSQSALSSGDDSGDVNDMNREKSEEEEEGGGNQAEAVATAEAVAETAEAETAEAEAAAETAEAETAEAEAEAETAEAETAEAAEAETAEADAETEAEAETETAEAAEAETAEADADAETAEAETETEADAETAEAEAEAEVSPVMMAEDPPPLPEADLPDEISEGESRETAEGIDAAKADAATAVEMANEERASETEVRNEAEDSEGAVRMASETEVRTEAEDSEGAVGMAIEIADSDGGRAEKETEDSAGEEGSEGGEHREEETEQEEIGGLEESEAQEQRAGEQDSHENGYDREAAGQESEAAREQLHTQPRDDDQAQGHNHNGGAHDHGAATLPSSASPPTDQHSPDQPPHNQAASAASAASAAAGHAPSALEQMTLALNAATQLTLPMHASVLLSSAQRALNARGPTDKGVLIAATQLSGQLRMQYFLPEALTLGRALVAARIEANGSEALEVASALLDLGEALRKSKQYAEAEDCFHRAVAIRRTQCGNEHPQTASALNAYAVTLQEQGKTEPASLMLKEAFEIFSRVGPPDREEGPRASPPPHPPALFRTGLTSPCFPAVGQAGLGPHEGPQQRQGPPVVRSERNCQRMYVLQPLGLHNSPTGGAPSNLPASLTNRHQSHGAS